ncbi:hypothetical protein BSK20_02095 [SR1 bacterium human oral taxon HOT-345]|nr:hypothetical protein BSK20_02095 [SR1 bacterium human oral taxon HOT-345]
MNKKKETKGEFVGMLAIACVIAAMLMPPKVKSGSSLEGERKVDEWEIPIKEKDPKLALEKDQDFFSPDSLMKEVVERMREKRPLFDRQIFEFRAEW